MNPKASCTLQPSAGPRIKAKTPVVTRKIIGKMMKMNIDLGDGDLYLDLRKYVA